MILILTYTVKNSLAAIFSQLSEKCSFLTTIWSKQSEIEITLGALLLSAATYRLLITFANSLDPNQDDKRPFDTLAVFLKELFEKVNFEKVSRRQQKHGQLPSMQGVKIN